MGDRIKPVISDQELFHVHTFRCRHAEEVPDRAYVEKALELGAKGIWFTDHCPFPGDLFKREHRMLYKELPEYINTLKGLKEEYSGRIDIHIGLETEFFQRYNEMGYYEELRWNKDIEMLLLGQHMAELPDGRYSYDLDKESLIEQEFKLLGVEMILGIQSGYFDAVAHPDRIFRRRPVWDSEMNDMAVSIIDSAQLAGIPLEQNESSKAVKNYYREEFWELAKGKMDIICGLDAHFIRELKLVKNSI